MLQCKRDFLHSFGAQARNGWNNLDHRKLHKACLTIKLKPECLNSPPIHWNYFNQHQPRTNNNVEGWHSRMKKVISKPHPNIFAWIEYIQREEAVTKAKIQSFRSGATARPRRRRMKEKEKRIQTLFDRFSAGNTTLNEYLEAIKHLTGL